MWNLYFHYLLRKDYLINISLSTAEAAGFYRPFIPLVIASRAVDRIPAALNVPV